MASENEDKQYLLRNNTGNNTRKCIDERQTSKTDGGPEGLSTQNVTPGQKLPQSNLSAEGKTKEYTHDVNQTFKAG
jgi:hypothetical protein